MIPQDLTTKDEILEYAAQLIEESSFLDRSPKARRKRDREDNDLKFNAIVEARRECATRIRSMKSRDDLDALKVLQTIAELPNLCRHYEYHLRHAWPLAWKGWVDIFCTIRCNSNVVPPETLYRIELTELGKAVLAERGKKSEVPL